MAHPYLALRPNRNVLVSHYVMVNHYVMTSSKNPLPLGMGSVKNVLCISSCEPFIKPDTNYVVSQKIKIYSEYRVFVWKNNIQAIQNYNGMPDVFPDIQTVKNMITTYSKYPHPQAYTLDVAVTNDFQTAIMEIHPFVSCGLYGFYNEKIPDMLESGVNWYLSQNFNKSRQF